MMRDDRRGDARREKDVADAEEVTEAADESVEEAAGAGAENPAEADTAPWQPPPAQPVRFVLALALIAAGAALYGFVLTSFWSSPNLGIHDRIPYPAYVLIAASLMLALAGLRLSLGIWSPHAKLGIGMLGLLTSVALGVGGGRFASYTLRGTLNPSFTLHLAAGDHFPDFALNDQRAAIHTLGDSAARGLTLIVVYRGDFCPFARFELAELTSHARELDAAGVHVVAISTDPADRSIKLAAFLHTGIPLLSDPSETLLGALGLIQHHRNGEPDNAIPACFLIDSSGVVQWVFTSPYYRELPRIADVVDAARSLSPSR